MIKEYVHTSLLTKSLLSIFDYLLSPVVIRIEVVAESLPLGLLGVAIFFSLPDRSDHVFAQTLVAVKRLHVEHIQVLW